VRDTGIGIPEDVQKNLFQRFVQADSSTTRHFGGTGLGLAICRRLVELMHGEIGVISAPGRGSTFWFVIETGLADALPAVSADDRVFDGNRAIGSGEPSFTERAKPEGPARILVAEDNLVNQKVALRFLKNAGYAADVVGNGKDAVDAVRTGNHSLVLMDVQMPVMDGLEAAQQIRRAQAAGEPGVAREIRIIAMTANAMSGDRELCLAAGMDDYIPKPLTPSSLKQALDRYLGDKVATE
jgi:CheY-like chemotaxis protein